MLVLLKEPSPAFLCVSYSSKHLGDFVSNPVRQPLPAGKAGLKCFSDGNRNRQTDIFFQQKKQILLQLQMFGAETTNILLLDRTLLFPANAFCTSVFHISRGLWGEKRPFPSCPHTDVIRMARAAPGEPLCLLPHVPALAPGAFCRGQDPCPCFAEGEGSTGTCPAQGCVAKCPQCQPTSLTTEPHNPTSFTAERAGRSTSRTGLRRPERCNVRGQE